MPKCQLLMRTEDDDAPLGAVWLYLRRGGAVSVTRTESSADLAGVALALKKGGHEARPWNYTDPFVIEVPPEEVEVFHSKGPRPIPLKVFDDFGAVFIKRPLAPAKALVVVARVAPNVKQMLSRLPVMAARVPRILIELALTAEFAVGPCVGEIGEADSARKAGSKATGGEPAEPPPPAPPPPHPESAVDSIDVAGRVAAGAKSVRIRILDPSGTALDLRETATSSDVVKEIVRPTLPGAKDEATVRFSTTVYFNEKVDVHASASILVAVTDGLSPPVLDVFALSGCEVEPPKPVAMAAAGGSEPPPTLPIGELGFLDSVLGPPLSTPERTAFKRHVYNAHIASSRGIYNKRFLYGLPAGQTLAEVEGGHMMRDDAAAACKNLLARARADFAIDLANKDDLALKVRVSKRGSPAIGAASGYRNAVKELGLWQDYFPSYYYQCTKQRVAAATKEKSAGEVPADSTQAAIFKWWREYFPADVAEASVAFGTEHGPAAVCAMVIHFRKLKAAPGYSNHTTGIAMDFGTTQEFVVEGLTGNVSLGPSRKAKLVVDEKTKVEVDAVELWRGSWFYHWLGGEDAKFPGKKRKMGEFFDFFELDSEEWHWDYRLRAKPAAGK